MLSKIQLKKYADILLWGLEIAREKRLVSGDSILLQADIAAMPLVETVYARLMEQGAYPVLRLSAPESVQQTYFKLANEDQLDFIPYGEEELLSNIQGLISIRAPRSLTHLQKIKTEKLAYAARAVGKLKNITSRREAKGEYSWCLAVYPTPELAAYAGMTPSAYARQVVKACHLSAKDPVAVWQEIYQEVTAVKSWLNGLNIKTLEVAGAGCDFSIGLGEKRQWLGISGRNMPSFEIFTSPDLSTTRGHFFADQPSFRDGNIIADAHLEFMNGRVVRSSAKAGGRYLKAQLNADEGASYVGEFSLTDKRFSKISAFMANTLYDENYGGRYGNCHVALGSAYLNAYAGDCAALSTGDIKALGFNVSSIHWDLINIGNKVVTAILPDGKRTLIYENGMFRY